MSDTRAATIERISAALGSRSLMWVGTRGTDAQPLYCFEQFNAVACLVAPLGMGEQIGRTEVCLEALSGLRVDLNAYDIDADTSEHMVAFQAHLLSAMTSNTAVVAYRPSEVMASAYFPRKHLANYLGMFHAHQGAFDYKPWVECELAKRGVNTIPWRYFAPDDIEVLREVTSSGQWVFRSNRSDGGIGVFPVSAGEAHAITIGPESVGWYAALSEFFDQSVPLNVSACVFPDGTVTVRNPSLQLIGVDWCTSRPFGYCGNDFAAVAASLSVGQIDELELLARSTGQWLHEMGYRGAFGIDALATDEGVMLTEVNPRFQGCSAASADVGRRTGEADVYLDHLCSLLGLSAPEGRSLFEQAEEQARPGMRLSQVISYNTAGKPLRYLAPTCPPPTMSEVWGLPDRGLLVEGEALLFKMLVEDSVTSDGYSISEAAVRHEADAVKSVCYEEY